MIESNPVLEFQLEYRVHDSLQIDVGLRLGSEIGVIFGPSGCGKTTLLKLITGLLTPDAGFVRLGGITLFDSSRGVNEALRKRRIGLIFQDDLLFPHLGVADNIRFGLKGWDHASVARRLAEVATICGVEHLLERSTASLSGGERQRVGLARALAPRPQLLLCDEPVSALDLAGRNALISRLRGIQRTLQIPVVYVTHSPSEAIRLGNRLHLMSSGRFQADGPPLDVLAGASAGSGIPLEDLHNAFPAQVETHEVDKGVSQLRLEGGPLLKVSRLEYPIGTAVEVEVRGDDILLARGVIEGLSAQNLIEGTVKRIVRHGDEAEVLIRTGQINWIASVLASAIDHLSLAPETRLFMIIKARSCHVTAIPSS